MVSPFANRQWQLVVICTSQWLDGRFANTSRFIPGESIGMTSRFIDQSQSAYADTDFLGQISRREKPGDKDGGVFEGIQHSRAIVSDVRVENKIRENMRK